MSGEPPEMPEMTADDALAMDYALGALDRPSRRNVETRLRSDPAFRALVEAWQASLAPLDEATAPVAPPADLWERIAAETAPPAPVRAAAPAPSRGGFWQNLAVWRGLALAGSIAAVVAIAGVGQRGPVAPAAAPPQLLVASLAASDGTPLLSATYDPLRGSVALAPATAADHRGRSPELWVIVDGQPPKSLGLIDIDGANAHAIPAERLQGLKPGATLAISIEPQGGSPTGLPTGPVVATGKLVAI